MVQHQNRANDMDGVKPIYFSTAHRNGAPLFVQRKPHARRGVQNKTQRLVIYYKFVGYLDIDPTQCHPNYTADIREGVAVEYVSCEPTPEVTYSPDISPEARKEYAERVIARHKEKTEQG